MKLTSRLATAAATAALVLGAVAPSAFANTNISVIGNGSSSQTSVSVSSKTGTSIGQSNETSVGTEIISGANTGNNTANSNTNGTVIVNTGNATSNTNVTTFGSSNKATVTSNCGCKTNTHIGVIGNGNYSKTSVTVSGGNWFSALQENVTEVMAGITSFTNTGGNNSNGNTGTGVGIGTGDSVSNVTVYTKGSWNTLTKN